MPGLARSEWYDLTRDMNWTLSYVDQEEAWPGDLSNAYGIPAENWCGWDEPYKITYSEYVHNQVGKDAGVYSVNSVCSEPCKWIFEQNPGRFKGHLSHHVAGRQVAAQDRPMRVRHQGKFLAGRGHRG